MIKTLPQTFDLQEYYDSVDKTRQMIEAKAYPVQLISDYAHVQKAPTNGMACSRYASKNTPHNLSQAVFVNVGKWIGIFMSLAKDLKLKGYDTIHMADSLEEALQILREHEGES